MPLGIAKARGHSISGTASLAGLALLAALGGLASVGVTGGEPERQVMEVAVPEPVWERPTWEAERQAFAVKLTQGYGVAPSDAVQFAGWIIEASVRHELAPELLASVVMAESAFRKHARSSVGAVGPAQVRAKFWRSFCGADLMDPEQNLYCGAHILAHYREACARQSPDNAEDCALRSYNVGYSNRNKLGFLAAGNRYIAKIDRYREPLTDAWIRRLVSPHRKRELRARPEHFAGPQDGVRVGGVVGGVRKLLGL